MRFSISKSTNGQYYFEIQAAGNYATLATSETYTTKQACQDAINLIKAQAATATTVDHT
ncbi:MAG TPA: YegP family protein [Chloroflexota bacterium]|jgi:hypothetical protein